ncbi:MAG TPA: c-type cytochrome [Burkholderiaceae bacterium]|nr:c-type cytochrome [Burkholderiaceae bacterium]
MRRLDFWLFSAVLALASMPGQSAPLDEQVKACTHCHGPQGKAGPDGYYPRLAGKPAAYLYQQLTHFRDSRRHYGLMTHLMQNLGDGYLQEIAEHFAAQSLPYPPPPAVPQGAAQAEQARKLVRSGDAPRGLPACASCHGERLTGMLPATPALLGLPRDYLNAQLGAWQTGQRRAHAPDCMATVARKLAPREVAALATWLSSQPVPADSRPSPSPAGPPAVRCGSFDPPAPPAEPRLSGEAARGAYLARIGNCQTCHTAPGQPDYAGGRAIPTPFGNVFAGNLTPEAATGIGAWTAQDFTRALREGISKDGRLLAPAFPYTHTTRLAQADIDALWAYFRPVAPASRANAPHQLRWPFGTQTALWAWRKLYFTPGEYRPEPARSAEWNRGAYLAEGLGHCGACHAPRNRWGATSHAERFSGGVIPMQNWLAPPPTDNAEAGLGGGSVEDGMQLLRAGRNPHATVSGPMAEVTRASLQYLSDADARALTVFLRALSSPAPGRQGSSPSAFEAASARVLQRGETLYADHCADCHGKQGEGQANRYPRLAAGNRAVAQANPVNLVQIVLFGGYAPVTKDNPRPHGMPPFVQTLSDADLAATLSFVRGAWGNRAGAVSELDVARIRDATRANP